MKTIKVMVLLVSLMLPTYSTGVAQEKQSDNSDVLRGRLTELETVRVDGKPVSIQTLHKRALLSIHSQLRDSIDDDIKALRIMQAAVGSSDPETRREIDNQIQKLTRERTEISSRIERMRGDLSASTNQFDNNRSVTLSSEPTGSSVSGSGLARADSPVTSSMSSGPMDTRLEPRSGLPLVLPQNVDVKNCKLTNTYKDAPELLVQRVEQAAKTIAMDTSSDPEDRLSGLSAVYPYMMFFTVADAVLPEGIANAPAANIRTIERLQYLGETARTDKQIGASARAAGSTSAIEKPGFARLLGFAVESGAILQDVNSSNLTLSTSPYILYTMNGGGDTVENYNRAGFLNRIGVAASFNMSDKADPLGNAKRGELTEWSVKARLFGDRSTRSKEFQRFWDRDVRPFVEAKGRAIGEPINFIDDNPVLRSLSNQTRDQLKSALRQLFDEPDYKNGSEAQKEVMLQNVMLCYMRTAVFDQIRSNAVDVGLEARTKINDEYVPRVAQAFANMAEAKKRLNAGLEDLYRSPLATLAYTNHRQPLGSDYSEFKFLYEQDKSLFGMLKIVGNAGLAIYNKPNPLLNQTRIRDFEAALSFEGVIDRPFLKDQPDLSKITYAFTGSYQRMKENVGLAGRKPDLAAFQFKVDVPIYGGMTLPLAVTYASGTETTNKEHTRLNFGFKFDMDKLFALTKLTGKP